jgi:hypothetical protein
MKSLLRIVQLLFFPTAFREAEVEHIRALNAKGHLMSDPESFRPEAEKRIAKKRKGLLISFLIVMVLVFLGFAASTIVNRFFPLPVVVVRWLRMTSVIVIAWSVLGRIGETETWSGETLIEVTSLQVFRKFYGLGVFFMTFALFLEG